MRSVFGPRTAVEAVFLVAVPVVVLIAGQSPAVIIAASAAAYLAVLVFEALLWRNRPQQTGAAAQPGADLPETVRVIPAAEAEPAVLSDTAAPEPEPEPEPARVPVPVLVPEPVAVAATPEPAPMPTPAAQEEHVRVLHPLPTPAPEPEPEPQPAQGPQLPPAAEAPPAVVPIGIGAAPREWNLWDLERLSREHAGIDAARDEERSFLLMYLRDFAGPDGMLPVDFDGLVRDSFGDLVGAR